MKDRRIFNLTSHFRPTIEFKKNLYEQGFTLEDFGKNSPNDVMTILADIANGNCKKPLTTIDADLFEDLLMARSHKTQELRCVRAKVNEIRKDYSKFVVKYEKTKVVAGILASIALASIAGLIISNL